MFRDPRVYQVLFLGALLGTGALLRDFSIRPLQSLLAFVFAIATQVACSRAVGAPKTNVLSAVITALSLSLLLRADSYWVHPVAATVAIGAKFLVRVRGKHLFNPGNLGVVAALIVLPGSWVSGGQWGQDVALAGWFVALGAAVTTKARRADVSWTFLAVYLGLVGLRVLWLGQRPEVWLHQLTNGALLLFAFFMISDPMTIPNRTRGRVLYAALVAGLAFTLQYGFFRTNALLWALFVLSPLVPVIDRLWPGPRCEWSSTGGTHVRSPDPGPPALREFAPVPALAPRPSLRPARGVSRAT
jgi:Na+-transporting NADH:ubiquinone oxidoreductase subunit NqrB